MELSKIKRKDLSYNGIYVIKNLINNKIYIGKDLTWTFRYFWSVNSKLLENDFTEDEKRVFTITREILWQSDSASDEEVNKKEVEYIMQYQSNNPKIGYNQWPKFNQ